MSRALTHFSREFFQGTNERVRVHFRGETDRQQEYYSELRGILPGETLRGADLSQKFTPSAPSPAPARRSSADSPCSASAQSIPWPDTSARIRQYG